MCSCTCLVFPVFACVCWNLLVTDLALCALGLLLSMFVVMLINSLGKQYGIPLLDGGPFAFLSLHIPDIVAAIIVAGPSLLLKVSHQHKVEERGREGGKEREGRMAGEGGTDGRRGGKERQRQRQRQTDRQSVWLCDMISPALRMCAPTLAVVCRPPATKEHCESRVYQGRQLLHQLA